MKFEPHNLYYIYIICILLIIIISFLKNFLEERYDVVCISSVITALNFLHISDQWFLLLKMGVHFGTKLERKNLFPMRYLSQWKSKDPHTNSAHRPSVSQRYHTGSIFAEKWVYDNDKNSKVFIKTFGSHFTLKNLIENIPKIQLCSTWFKTPLLFSAMSLHKIWWVFSVHQP